jgi:hypothetical protein
MEFVIKFLAKLKGLALIAAVLCISPMAYPMLVRDIDLRLFSILYFIYVTVFAVMIVIGILVRPDTIITLLGAKTSRYDIFISAPMEANASCSFSYAEMQKNAVDIYQLLRAMDLRVFCALVDKVHHDNFDTPLATLDQNIPALYGMRYYVLIWPGPLSTGALVEAGFALALKKPAVIFVRKMDDLPWILRKSNEFRVNWQIVRYEQLDEIKTLILHNRSAWFPNCKISMGRTDSAATDIV